jgi:hypothetical protein
MYVLRQLFYVLLISLACVGYASAQTEAGAANTTSNAPAVIASTAAAPYSFFRATRSLLPPATPRPVDAPARAPLSCLRP